MLSFKRGGSHFEDAEFRRAIGGEVRLASAAPAARRSGPVVTLVPMRSLSLDVFSFPFSNTTKVREALNLQVMPYAAAGDVEIFPVILERVGRGAKGVAWFVSPDELDLPEDAGTVWPAPLPLVSRVEGTGVTLWADEENLCSLLWQEGRPLLSRWRPRRVEPESELAWFDLYCKEQSLERGGSFVLDAAQEGALEPLREIVAEGLALCPWMGTVNLSRAALEGAMGLERSVGLMTRAAVWLLLMGGVVLGGSLLRWDQIQGRVQELRGRSEELYRETFEPGRVGRIPDPVSLARGRLASIQSGPEGQGFDDALAYLGAIFTQDPSMDITVDVLRYNAEGLDCTGLAPDMSTILAFRRAWEGRASQARIDNTQSVAGVGYRFDLRVRW